MSPAVAGAVSTSDGRVTKTRRLCVCACSSPDLPDRRLPDAGGPFEDQRRRRRPVEEPTDGLHLGLATKDVRDGHSFGQTMGSRRSTCIADPIRSGTTRAPLTRGPRTACPDPVSWSDSYDWLVDVIARAHAGPGVASGRCPPRAESTAARCDHLSLP